MKQSKKLSEYSIHSKQDAELNQEILTKFDSGAIREVRSVRSLTLGLNIKGANYIEKESFNGSEVNFQQQAGRSDRLDVDDIATVIWIVPIDTQAEQWYNKAVKNIPDEELAIFTDINELLKEI